MDTDGKGMSLTKTSTLLKELSANTESVFISQGDMWQGSVESNLTRGNLVTEWMNDLDFVSMTVGNHEFDWGYQRIVENQELSDFPILGINVLNRSNNKRVDYLYPSTTFERGGAKIGVIGAIGDCLSSISGSKVRDVYFATGSALTNLVKQESTRLRNEEHCDFIIYSLHGTYGGGDYDEELSSGHYVDLVLEGHSHANYVETDSYGIYHIQGNAYNQNFYKIVVDLDLTNGTYDINDPVSYDTRNDSEYRNYSEDPNAKAIFNKYKDQFEFAYQVTGYNNKTRYATELKTKVSELYYEAGTSKWGSSYNLLLGGGYISCRGNNLPAGDVTYANLYNLFPFDNDVVLCSVKGSNLRNTQFIIGSSNYYVQWSDYGNQVKENIDDSATYYLVTDTYTSDYYSTLTVIDEYDTNGVYARDLFNTFIANGGYGTKPQPQQGHDGTISDPKTIAEGMAYATEHPGNNASSSGADSFFYKGVVSRQATGIGSSGDLASVYVKDADGDSDMMIYYLKKTQNGSSTWESVDDLALGDVIIFSAVAFNFRSTTLEFGNAWLYSINGVTTM